MDIKSSIESIEEGLPEGTRLVAVSKFHPVESIIEAYDAGQRLFGESRVQELVAKYEELSNLYLDINWHFIGPLQTNKVKYIAPFIDMIQSVDSRKLLDEINKQALKHQRQIPILLEVHVAQEESKSGFTPSELLDLIQYMHAHPEQYQGILLSGLMTMASFTDDQGQISQEFASLKSLYDQILASGLLLDPEEFCELSMGMSGDYHLAIAHGSTLVRIGTAIFGERNY